MDEAEKAYKKRSNMSPIISNLASLSQPSLRSKWNMDDLYDIFKDLSELYIEFYTEEIKSGILTYQVRT